MGFRPASLLLCVISMCLVLDLMLKQVYSVIRIDAEVFDAYDHHC